MSRTRVKLNHAGFRELLTGIEVRADLGDRAERIAAAAGDGYEISANTGRSGRAGYTVYPATREAIVEEARDHGLLAALDAGRD